MNETTIDWSNVSGLTATVSLDDGWIRLYLGERLDRETFAALAKATGLNWNRAEACLLGPYLPQAEDFLAGLGVTLDEENVDWRVVAEQRAQHYTRWAEGAADRAETAAAAERDIMSFIPMGQPILVGHHSEARARSDRAKADRLTRRYLEERERAEHWEERAVTTVRHAERRYTADQLTSRIGMLEASLRGYERRLGEEGLSAGRQDWNRRMRAFTEKRLAYARELLAEAEVEAGGDVTHSVAARLALAIEVGGGVSTDPPDSPYDTWYEVVRVNPKTVTVCYWLGVKSLTYRLKREEIKRTMTADEWATAEKWSRGAGLAVRRAKPDEVSHE